MSLATYLHMSLSEPTAHINLGSNTCMAFTRISIFALDNQLSGPDHLLRFVEARSHRCLVTIISPNLSVKHPGVRGGYNCSAPLPLLKKKISSQKDG